MARIRAAGRFPYFPPAKLHGQGAPTATRLASLKYETSHRLNDRGDGGFLRCIRSRGGSRNNVSKRAGLIGVYMIEDYGQVLTTSPGVEIR